MHPRAVREEVIRLAEQGIRDGDIAHRTGLPRTTVRDMRRPRRWDRPICPRCWRPGRPLSFSDADYAELLGLYLGDGCIVRVGRAHCLRLSLDARYPGIVADTVGLLRRCFPHNRVGQLRRDSGATVVVWTYSMHLPCVLPQHGAGKKHTRSLGLEPWQWTIVERAPWPFLRGCIRSDGCVFINRTGPYEYLAYDFCNLSEDLLRLFARVCEVVGAEYRRYPPRPRVEASNDRPDYSGAMRGGRVRIYRRESVALFRSNVGLKH